MTWPTKKLGEIYRNMFGINVPFVQQSHINSCGAAALEMIYRYYGDWKTVSGTFFLKNKNLLRQNLDSLRYKYIILN